MSKMYGRMREAINKKGYDEIASIINDSHYEPNITGGKDQRTALHVAAMADDPVTISLLLQQQGIDPNVQTSPGELTPLMLAAVKMRIEAIERLLNDDRVDTTKVNDEDEKAEDLIPLNAAEFDKYKVKLLFRNANRKGQKIDKSANFALIMVNSNYSKFKGEDGRATGWDDLPGAEADLEQMKQLLEKYYTVVCIKDAAEISEEIKGAMEKLDDESVENFEFLFSGDKPSVIPFSHDHMLKGGREIQIEFDRMMIMMDEGGRDT